MKPVYFAALVLLAAGMTAQSAPDNTNHKNNSALQAETLRKAIAPPQKAAVNQVIVTPRISYSGSVVEAVKTKAPLQLINPFAGASYGDGMQNVTTDLNHTHATGLKLFAIDF